MNETADPSREKTAYPVWWAERVRFADTDMFGHVNHAAVATLFETGRAPLAFSTVRHDLLPPGSAALVRVLRLDYLGELRYPAHLDIGLRIAHIGRSSFLVDQLLLDGDRAAATARLTYVLIDRSSGRSTAIPEALRAYLMSLS